MQQFHQWIQFLCTQCLLESGKVLWTEQRNSGFQKSWNFLNSLENVSFAGRLASKRKWRPYLSLLLQ
jgi:hypothetical protein